VDELAFLTMAEYLRIARREVLHLGR